MNTTITFIHLQVLVRVAGKETIESDFQQRALVELNTIGLVEGLRQTRPFANGSPRMRADLSAKGQDCIDAIMTVLAKGARE